MGNNVWLKSICLINQIAFMACNGLPLLYDRIEEINGLLVGVMKIAQKHCQSAISVAQLEHFCLHQEV